MGELVGGGYTLLYVYYLVWYTDLGGRGVFRRLTSLLYVKVGIITSLDVPRYNAFHISGFSRDCHPWYGCLLGAWKTLWRRGSVSRPEWWVILRWGLWERSCFLSKWVPLVWWQLLFGSASNLRWPRGLSRPLRWGDMLTRMSFWLSPLWAVVFYVGYCLFEWRAAMWWKRWLLEWYRWKQLQHYLSD